MDMCCGIGTISLLAARKAKYVLGVEVNPKSIQDARKNAVRNHIRNAEFLAMDGEEFIHELMDTPDVVFLDPPRSGFSESFMRTLQKLSPERIVYVSCNPITQARDLKVISGTYHIDQIQPVDNFPFTTELECIVSLTRKQIKDKNTFHRSKR